MDSHRPVQEISDIDKNFENLFSDFAKIYSVKNSLKCDFELLERSKEYSKDFGLSSEEYQALFKSYCLAQKKTKWIDQSLEILQGLSKFLQGIALLGILFGTYQFMIDLKDREVKNISDAWKTIDGLEVKKIDETIPNPERLNQKEFDNKILTLRKFDGGRKKAIEYLNKKGEILYDLPLSGAALPWLNLPPNSIRGAQLQGSKFIGARLTYSYFGGANLAQAKFQHANMDYVNFTGADLTNADFRYASLQYSCFQGAKLSGAKFNNPEWLRGDDFGDLSKLTPKQIQEQGLDSAEVYVNDKESDKTLKEWLQINKISKEKGSDGHGCNIHPKTKSIWDRIFLGN
jgi:uncharacterized protein YjbI with pentapeptide repeats